MKNKRKFLVLRTYILMLFIKTILPEDHDWKQKDITLDDWEKKSTKLNDAFSIGFWAYIVIMVCVALEYFNVCIQ